MSSNRFTFDRLCEWADQRSDSIREKLAVSRLFCLEFEQSIHAHEGGLSARLLEDGLPEAAVKLRDFQLPFEVVALEDAACPCCTNRGCTLIWREAPDRLGFVNSNYDSRGVFGVAWGTLLLGDRMEVGAFEGGVESPRGKWERWMPAWQCIPLPADPEQKRRKLELLERTVDTNALGSDPDKLLRFSHTVCREMVRLEALRAGLHLVRLTQPSEFVVEKSNVRPTARKSPKGRVPRSDQRPHYIVLRPEEIRRRMKLPPPEKREPGQKRLPHERRGHWRRYPDDEKRYPQAHGELRWVRPCWIGPQEAVVGKNQYRVILSEPSEVAHAG